MQNAPTARVWYRESKYCSAERNWGPEREGNTRMETSKYRHTASFAPRESAAITYSGLAKEHLVSHILDETETTF